MSVRAPNPAVEQIIAELSAMHVDDIENILSALSVEESQYIQKLMRSNVSRFEEVLTSSVLNFDASRLSEWLVRWLPETSPEGAGMTPLARKTLRDCAVELFPQRSPL